MINNNDDEIKNFVKTFEDLANITKVKSNSVTNSLKELESKDLYKQLKDEAAKNLHKRKQRMLDFFVDSLINLIKCLAIVAPIVIVLLLWAYTKHHGYADLANEIIILSKRFFDMFIGFFLGNFLNSLFSNRKNQEK